jgi:manganese transport protein
VLKLPLWVGAVLAAACAFLLLGLRSSIPQGYRVIEYIILVLVAIVSVSFIYLIVVTKPSARSVGEGLIPSIPSVDALYIAMSMIGATIMPHSVYLHPSIVQDRRKYLVLSQGDSEDVHRRHIRFESADTIIALFAAMFVNGSMVIVASACLFQSGISSIEEAFELIEKTVGNNVSTIFGAALIISGLASSVVCTMAGQEVMDGFLNWKVHVWIRRSVTLVPSLIIVLAELNPTKVLVASQVALSFELPFVLIPLYMFTKDRDLMGPFVNGRITILLFFVFLSLLVGLNIWLLVSAIFG